MNNACCDIKIAIMYRKDQNPQAQKWNDGGGRHAFFEVAFLSLSPFHLLWDDILGSYFGKKSR